MAVSRLLRMVSSRGDLAVSWCVAWTSACVGVSGSVAAVKAPELASALLRAGARVDVVLLGLVGGVVEDAAAFYVDALEGGESIVERRGLRPRHWPRVSVAPYGMSGRRQERAEEHRASHNCARVDGFDLRELFGSPGEQRQLGRMRS